MKEKKEKMMSQRKLKQKKKTIKKIKHHPEKSNFQHGVWMGVDRAINKKQAHTKTYKDWCNFLSDKIRWCLNIIICHKIQVMFDILNTKYNSDTELQLGEYFGENDPDFHDRPGT